MIEDFIEDNELLEELDTFIEIISENMADEKTHILNPDRIKEMEFSFDTFSKIFLDVSPEAKINCELSKLTPTQAAITVETDEIIIQNITEFINSIEGANNFEIYSLNNGKIKIAIMFHGVMREM